MLLLQHRQIMLPFRNLKFESCIFRAKLFQFFLVASSRAFDAENGGFEKIFCMRFRLLTLQLASCYALA